MFNNLSFSLSHIRAEQLFPEFLEISGQNLNSSRTRKRYYEYLNSELELDPLKKLYGIRASFPLPSQSEMDNHIKKIVRKIHPDKVPPEEKDLCTELFKYVTEARNACFPNSQIPPLFFMQPMPETDRIQYMNAAEEIKQAFIPNIYSLINNSLLLLEGRCQLEQENSLSCFTNKLYAWSHWMFYYLNLTYAPQEQAIMDANILKSMKGFSEISSEEIISDFRKEMVDLGILQNYDIFTFTWNPQLTDWFQTTDGCILRLLVLARMFLLPRTKKKR